MCITVIKIWYKVNKNLNGPINRLYFLYEKQGNYDPDIFLGDSLMR